MPISLCRDGQHQHQLLAKKRKEIDDVLPIEVDVLPLSMDVVVDDDGGGGVQLSQVSGILALSCEGPAHSRALSSQQSPVLRAQRPADTQQPTSKERQTNDKRMNNEQTMNNQTMNERTTMNKRTDNERSNER